MLQMLHVFPQHSLLLPRVDCINQEKFKNVLSIYRQQLSSLRTSFIYFSLIYMANED